RGQTVDARSDLFAFGAILYEMLAGQPAFRRATPADTLSAILKEEPPELAASSSAPPALDRILRHCLEKNPEDRFQSARDVAFDLESLSGAGGSSGARPALPAGKRRWGRRTALELAAGLLGLAAILLVLRLRTPAVPVFQRLTFQRGWVGAARFSPDGKTVFFDAAWNGEPPRVFSLLPDAPLPQRLDLPSSALLSVAHGGDLAVVAAPRYLPHQIPFGTVAQVPPNGGTPRDLLEDVRGADWAPDGSGLAVIRAVVGRWRLEYPVGHILFETSGWLTDVRFARDGRRLAFVEHPVMPDDAGHVMVVDLSGHATRLTGHYASLLGLAWSPDDREIWFSGALIGSSHTIDAVSLAGRVHQVLSAPGQLVLYDVAADGRVLLGRSDVRLQMLVQVPPAPPRDISWMDWTMAAEVLPGDRQVLFGEEGDGAGAHYAIALRTIDGRSAPVRLGDGLGSSVSPDGKWVAAARDSGLVLLPLGAGAERPLATPGLEDFSGAEFLPDGQHLLVAAHVAGKAARCFVVDLNGGTPRPVTPEGLIIGFLNHPVAPDGDHFIAQGPEGGLQIVSLRSGTMQPVRGTEPREIVSRWLSNQEILVSQRFSVSGQVFRVNPYTGTRRLWRTLMAPDPAGSVGVGTAQFSADGQICVFTAGHAISELYLAKGLR
ncbi:MAG: protein kinase, partial [Terriglobales bacterium]